MLAALFLCDISSPFLLPSFSLPSPLLLPSYTLFDDSDVLGFDVGAEGAEHFEVDEEHALGTAFGFEEGAFVAVEEAADDLDAVSLLQFHFVGMEVGDVVLHLRGGVDEEFHFAGGDLEDLELAVHLLVAVGDEGVEVLDGVESAERGEDEDGVGDEGAFHDDFLSLYGHVGGSHGTIGTQSRLFERGDGQRFFPADFQGEPLGLVLHG